MRTSRSILIFISILLLSVAIFLSNRKQKPPPATSAPAAVSSAPASDPPLPAPATTVSPIPVNPALADALTDAVSPPFHVTAVLQPASPQLLNETLAALKTSGDQLKSLHAYGRYVEEKFDYLRKTWRDAATIEGDGFYELASHRGRFDVLSHQTIWYASPHDLRERYIQVFDGTTFLRSPKAAPMINLNTSGGTMPLDSLSVVANPFAFPLYQAFDNNTDGTTHRYSLYTAINPATASARRVTLNDSQPAIELSFHYLHFSDPVDDIWYLDPDHAYALLATQTAEHYADNSTNHYIMVIHALAQAAPGIFFPQHASMICGTNNNPASRGTYTACSLIANESHPDSFFTLGPLPN